MTTRRRIEIDLLFVALAVNFVWEMLQMPLFAYPAQTSSVQIVLACFQASAGDAGMLLLDFWIVAAFHEDRAWILHPSARSLTLFLLPGLVMTIAFEALATGPLHRWAYAEAMPTLPWLGTGMAPLAQWLIVPLIVISIVRRRV